MRWRIRSLADGRGAEADRAYARWAPFYSTLHPSGAIEGWTRTFDTPDGRHSLAACWHPVDRHLGACRAAGLVVDARREPALQDHGSSAPRPVALVIRATRVS
jgi:hypothetical protein